MTNPIARFHNVENGEIIDRELINQEVNELANPKLVKSPSEQVATSNE